jgi:hypothetical protein
MDLETLRPLIFLIPFIIIGLCILIHWIRGALRNREFARWDKIAREAAERGDEQGVHDAVTGMMGYHK